MVWPRKARLLLVSSQAKPPGSQAASQNSFMKASASWVPSESITTLPDLVDLHAAEAPQQRIGEGRRVAEGVAERLADRQVVVLELPADLEILVPGVGHGETQLLEHVLAVDDRVADVEQRHAPGDPVDRGGAARPVVQPGRRAAPRNSALWSARPLANSCGWLAFIWITSAPLPLSIAAVIRAAMSFWLIFSTVISIPVAFVNSSACRSISTSAAGTKLLHCR